MNPQEQESGSDPTSPVNGMDESVEMIVHRARVAAFEEVMERIAVHHFANITPQNVAYEARNFVKNMRDVELERKPRIT